MSSGLATTLHFLYPIFVSIIMFTCFKQRISPFTIVAITLALGGVALLFAFGSGSLYLSFLSVVLVVLSGLCYAVYIVVVNNIKCLREMSNLKLTFYAMLFCSLIFLAQSVSAGSFVVVKDSSLWLNLGLLALVPTLVSNIALVKSVKVIGSTLTSVLGAMEPLVAILISVFVFNDPLTWNTFVGIVLILVAVLLIIISPFLDENVSKRLDHFKRRQINDYGI